MPAPVYRGLSNVFAIRHAGAEQIAANYVRDEGGFRVSNPNALRAYLKTRFPDANPQALTSVIRTTYAGFRAAAQQMGRRQQAPIPEALIPAVQDLSDPYRYYGEVTFVRPDTGQAQTIPLFHGEDVPLTRAEIETGLLRLATEVLAQYELSELTRLEIESRVSVRLTRIERRA